MSPLVELLISILRPIVQIIQWYFNLILNEGTNFWLGMGIVSLVCLAVLGGLNYTFFVISGLINQHPGQETMYKVLWKFRDARDNLRRAVSALEYTAGHYAPTMIGKVVVMRWVPPEYPDPNQTKAALADALDLIDDKKVDMQRIREIQEQLPDIEDIEIYRGKQVDEATFRGERETIWEFIRLVNEEIHELEIRLPRILIFWEKFVLRVRVGVIGLLYCIGGIAVLTLCIQGIVFLLRSL